MARRWRCLADALPAAGFLLALREVWRILCYGTLPLGLQQDGPMLAIGIGAALAVQAATSWRASGPIGRALRLTGDLIYGIYLIHITAIELVRRVIGWAGPPRSYWLVCLMLLIGSLPLSLSLGYIDTRMQSRLRGAASRAFAGSPREGSVAMPLQVA